VHGKRGKTLKTFALRVTEMYKKRDKEQLILTDFAMPFSGKLSPDNRWVKFAKEIPWDEIEDQYVAQFSKNRLGSPAKQFRMALGALIIKEKLNISDDETVEQIRENPYLQYFIGLSEFQNHAPFDSSMMTHFRKRISLQMVLKLNEKIVRDDNDENNDTSANGANDDEPPNTDVSKKGTLLVDATCTPADIRFPTDVSLLNESREKLEVIINKLHTPSMGKKPRTYKNIARKYFISFTKKRRPSMKEIRKALKKQLQFVSRDICHIKTLVKNGAALGKLSKKQYKDLLVIHELFRQQMEMFQAKNHSVEHRIVSISQPHVRPIVRGKAGANVEFGAKLSLSLVDGFARIEHLNWEAFNEGTLLKDHLLAYKEKYGYFPASVEVDQIYRNRENRKFCKKENIRMSGPSLGRPPKDGKKEKDNSGLRNPIEGKFGEGKRRYGLGRIMAHLALTSESTIGIIILVMNLEKRLRLLYDLLLNLIFYRLNLVISLETRAC
jgi:transposase, IS5 family